MARLPYLDKSDLLPEHQDLLARNLNLYRVLAHSPRAARSLNTLARYIRDGSRLDPQVARAGDPSGRYLTRIGLGVLAPRQDRARGRRFGRRDPRHCR